MMCLQNTNDSNGVLDKRFESHIWSRTASDGHRSYLNCNATNTDDCDLKIKVHNSIQSITKSQVQTEVDTIEGIFDGLNKKMSIDRVTSGTDNIIQRYGLDATYNGFTEYELHCTNWVIWCHTKDMHFEKVMVRINDDPSEILYGLSEDYTVFPPVQDIRKSLGHELFHAMGIDHNSSDDSIVSQSGYVTGATNGYNPSTTDIADLVARYP